MSTRKRGHERGILVRRAKKKRWKLKNRICEFEGCGRMFTAVTPRQRFCGSRLQKLGCSYLYAKSSSTRFRKAHPAMVRAWRKKWAAKHREIRKAQQAATYWRNRTKRLLAYAKYYKKNRAKILAQREMRRLGRPMNLIIGRPFYKDSNTSNLPIH